MKRILIVTPTLGERVCIVDSVQSVRDYPEVAHIVTCPSASAENLTNLLPSEVHVVPESRTGGVYGAVNDIIFRHGGDFDWVGYINDDDYWLPGMAKLIERSRSSRADIIYGRVQFVDWNKNKIVESTSTKFYWLFPFLATFGIYIFTQQAVLVRRSLFVRMRGFNEKYSIQADNDFWIRAMRSKVRCDYVSEVCAAYRLHDQQLSANKVGLQEREEMLRSFGLYPARFQSRLALLFYRMVNLPQYLRRFLSGRSSVKASVDRV